MSPRPIPASCPPRRSGPATYQAYSTQSASRSPFTIPRPGCRIPAMLSPSARRPRRLLQLYPLPNITGTPLYNYQVPVLNSTHQDASC